MAKLEWDKTNERLYETGVRMGVVYPYSTSDLSVTPSSDIQGITETKSHYGNGAAWNGLTNVTESPSGADPTDLYADDIKYLSIRAAETFGGTIESYTYPDEVAVLNGEVSLTKGVNIGQQSRGSFGFCYRTIVGNDTQYNDYGYKLHLVYGCTISPSERSYGTVNDSPEAITFSHEFESTPVTFTNQGKTYTTSIVTIDATKLDANGKKNLVKLENCLYGSEEQMAFLPLPDEVYTIMSAAAA